MGNYNITEVRLMNVPLEHDYKHTLYFSTREEQTNYFLSKSYDIATNFSYQRKDNVIRYPLNYDDLIGFNYVMYRNSSNSTKWYYAFITDFTYVHTDRTDITIETDVIQTWMFDYNIKASFVEREHVDSDEIGEHIVEEGLQMGDYVVNVKTKAGYHSLAKDYIIVGASQTAGGGRVYGTMYSGIYSGIKYYAFPHDTNGIGELEDFLSDYDSDAGGEAIICMFLAPDNIVEVDENIVVSHLPPKVVNINNTGSENNKDIVMTRNDLDGYEPRNMKLMTHPYRYLLASNNNGMSVIYKFEEFKGTEGVEVVDPQFEITGCLTPGCSVRMIPLNYKGIHTNQEEGINLGKYPTLNWTSDYYTNWLTQNAVNLTTSVVGDGVQIVGSLLAAPFTGGASLSGLGGGVSGIAGTMGEVYKASKVPPQSKGNTNCGDVVTVTQNNDFHFYDMSIKSQYAKIIDGYFDMFGYKVTDVKVPNVNHRNRYWYTKTIDVNIDGHMPMKDLQKIKDCYNRGITFWRYPEDIGDYSVDNWIR